MQPLTDHVTIKINGSLTSEDVFRTVLSMAVNRNSVHSITTQYQDVACETSLLYHLKKLNMEELILIPSLTMPEPTLLEGTDSFLLRFALAVMCLEAVMCLYMHQYCS